MGLHCAAALTPRPPPPRRALNTCPVDSVRVVVLGQDPYHDKGQAMGLSFSVPHGKAVPSSLRNIYKVRPARLVAPPHAHPHTNTTTTTTTRSGA